MSEHVHEWVATDVGCDFCGEHPGFFCDVCLEIVDSAYSYEEYHEIEQGLLL